MATFKVTFKVIDIQTELQYIAFLRKQSYQKSSILFERRHL
jgi:hypothetical protein